jgi:hypothetical protein
MRRPWGEEAFLSRDHRTAEFQDTPSLVRRQVESRRFVDQHGPLIDDGQCLSDKPWFPGVVEGIECGQAVFDADRSDETARGLANVEQVRGVWLDNDGGNLPY